MPTYAITDSGAGDFDIQSSIWTDGGSTLSLGLRGTNEVGFNLAIPATADTNDLFTSATLTFRISSISSGTFVGRTVQLLAYIDPSVGAVTSGSTPSEAPQYVLGSVAVSDTVPTTYTITVEPGFLNAAFRTILFTQSVASFTLECPEAVSGDVALVVAEETGSNGISLATEEHAEYTGWMDMPMDAHGRGTTDDRYGMPIFSTHRARDGFRPGFSVRPNDVDPAEVIPSYIPNPREGGFDDEPI